MRTLILGLLISLGLYAQTTPPDCQFTLSVTSTTITIGGTSFPIATPPTISNKATSTGGVTCIYWLYTYRTSGASGVSITMQGTNDIAGVAGTSFTALTATAGTTNPQTDTNEGAAIFCCDYYPWVRINPTTFTGTGQTMTVRVYGWRSNQGTSQGGGSAILGNVNVAEWGGAATSLGQKVMASSVPVVVASDQSTLAVQGLAASGAAPTSNPVPIGNLDSAGNLITPDYCTLKATVSGATLITGNTQLVAVSGSKTIRVCKWSFTTDTLTTAQLVTGTGATCTSSTAETGVYSGAGGGAFGVIEDYQSPLITTAAKTLCIALSAGVTATGGITVLYSQR